MEFIEKQKLEASKRIDLLKFHPDVKKSFNRKKRVLYYSEFHGILYWVTNREDLVNAIKDFEKETGNLVYHAIVSHIDGDEHLSLLYVSKYEDEWEMEREDLINGYPIVKVINLTSPDFSEYGSIGIQPIFGGLVRTY